MDGRNNLNLVKKNKDKEENGVKKADWSIILPELMKLIMSRLIVKDSIRASAVCKAWYKSSASVRMKDRHLWFMKCPIYIGTCVFYDPSQEITYTMELPEIAFMSVYYAKDGWLLMHRDRPSSDELFFFNPFSRKLIALPHCENRNECAVFTCAPTSDSCLVFGLANIDNSNKLVGVNTFRMGDTKWETSCFRSPEFFFAYYNKIIFSGGLFYCLGGLGSLAVFDPCKRTWNTHRIKYDGNFTPTTTTWFGTYVVEIKGDVFLLKILGGGVLRVFRLNLDEPWSWEDKERIDEGFTIFGAYRTSESRQDLTNCMRNKLLLSDSHHPMINTYFFREGQYLRNNTRIPFWDGRTIFQCIWIDTPKQLLDFE